MDLVFTGERGSLPDEDSIEYLVLAACCSEAAFPTCLVLRPGDFETAIERLQVLGWGFEWVTVH